MKQKSFWQTWKIGAIVIVLLLLIVGVLYWHATFITEKTQQKTQAPNAQKIIVEGFLEPLSRKMSYQVRAWISYLIDCKWIGRDLTIKTDEQLKAILEVEEVRYRETDIFESHYKYR